MLNKSILCDKALHKRIKNYTVRRVHSSSSPKNYRRFHSSLAEIYYFTSHYLDLKSQSMTIYFMHYVIIYALCESSKAWTSNLDVPGDNYMFKVNSRNTKTRCKVCSKLTIKTPLALFRCIYC